jgi:hypothetical protein
MEPPRPEYRNKTLLANWYEDRQQPTYNVVAACKEAKVRPLENEIQTTRYKRNPQLDTLNGRIMNDHSSERSYESSHKAAYDRKVSYVAQPKKRIVSIHKLSQHSDADAVRGFGGLLPRHAPNHGERVLHTTSHSYYGGPHAADPEWRHEFPAPDTKIAAGKSNYRTSTAAARTLDSGATGERLKAGDTDPMSHTFVQRTWVNNRDLQLNYLNRVKPAAQEERSSLPGLSLAIKSDFDNERTTYARRNDALNSNVGIWSG